MNSNWRLAMRIGGIVALFWIIDWGTYVIEWLWPRHFPLVVGGVEY